MLYLECNSGISGDMFVASMLSLGASQGKLLKALDSLHLDAQIEIGKTEKCGIQATTFVVHTGHDGHGHGDKDHEGRDHDGHGHGDHDEDEEEDHEGHKHHGKDHGKDHAKEDHAKGADHTDKNHGDKDKDHGDKDHSHEHEHRNLADITKIIAESSMTSRAKDLAMKIFAIVADAESKVHGVPRNEVHFHEVGAVDSIIDIAAAAVCLDDLNVTEAKITPIASGHGQVKCQHGIIPLPAPAVVEIAQAYALKLMPVDAEGETVTPTGAAIAAALYCGSNITGSYRILKTGTGAGRKNFPWPNVLRAYIIEEGIKTDITGGDPVHDSGLIMLETNIDDSTGEALGFVAERLMKEGAKDVFYIPVFMKKNRPAYLLKVICDAADREKMEDLIFLHTTTIGIRCIPVDRTALPRRIAFVDTPYGKAKVKIVTRKGNVFYYPEYEDVASIALASGKSFDGVYDEIRWLAQEHTHE